MPPRPRLGLRLKPCEEVERRLRFCWTAPMLEPGFKDPVPSARLRPLFDERSYHSSWSNSIFILEIRTMISQELKRSVTDAALELCCGNADLKGRLLFAVRALNVILVQPKDWPAILRQRAQEISDELNVGGMPERTIAGMDSQSARRLAERILQLYADCHIASAKADGDN